MATLTIFIHGIGSSSETWSKFVDVLNLDTDTRSLEEFTPGTTVVDENTEYYYLDDYETKIVSLPLLDKIKEIASGTKASGNILIDTHVDTLKTSISRYAKTFKSIHIVAHSLGGIVTMKLLLELNIENELTAKLKNILLYAAPLKGSNEPSKLKTFFGNKIPTIILKELAPDSLTITSLNQRIEQEISFLKDSFKICYIKGGSDTRIIEIKNEFIERFGEMKSIKGGHSEIINPKTMNSESFIEFKSFIYTHQSDTNKKQSENNIKKETLNFIDRLTISISITDWLNNNMEMTYLDVHSFMLQKSLTTEKRYKNELLNNVENFKESLRQHFEWLTAVFEYADPSKAIESYVDDSKLLFTAKEAYKDAFVELHSIVNENKFINRLNQEEKYLLLECINILIRKYS